MLTKTKLYIFKRIIVMLAFSMTVFQLPGQRIPEYPVSYRIFNPFVFNPAIAGSKDYSSIDLFLSSTGKSSSQLVGMNGRIQKFSPTYYKSRVTPDFTNFGAGGYIFNDDNPLFHNYGFSVTGSYHIKTDRNSLSFFSLGAAFKGIVSKNKNIENGMPEETSFLPGMDAGLYYYSPGFSSGIAISNIFFSGDSTIRNVAFPKQILLNFGYKLMISRQINLVIEPFLIFVSDLSFKGEPEDMIKPGLRLYAGNFCAGTFFNDYKGIPFFIGYKYNRVSLSVYIEIPQKTAFYREPALFELGLGINTSAIRSGLSRRNHW